MSIAEVTIMTAMTNTFMILMTLFSLVSCTGNKFGPDASSSKEEHSIQTPGISFGIARKAIQLLPYPMRISKLRYVVGSTDAALYEKIEERKNELGAYNYANGVNQELSWLETRMNLWTKGLQPICASEHMRARYPWQDGFRNFVFNAFGREPIDADNDIFNRINATNATSGEKFEVLCTTLLSSLEFLTL
jgi:hypothetical protein